MFYQYLALPQSMHLAPPGAKTCDYGSSLQQSNCEAAVEILARKAGKTPGRSFLVGSDGSCGDGSWGHVPLGCSVLSGADWTAHYKTGSTQYLRQYNTGAGCIHKNYQLVCYGMPNFLIVCVFFGNPVIFPTFFIES